MRIATVAVRSRQQSVERASCRRGEVEPDDGCLRQSLLECGHDGREALFQHQHLGCAIRQNEELLGDRETPVQRHQHRPKPRASIEQHEVVRPVEAEDGDAIAAADVELRLQRARRLRDAGGQCRVAQRLTLKPDGRLVGRKRRITFDQTTEIHRQSSVSPVS